MKKQKLDTGYAKIELLRVAEDRLAAIRAMSPEEMNQFMGKLRGCNALLDAISRNSGI